MTERQDREREKLHTLEDYLELLQILDSSLSDTCNVESIEKSLCQSISIVGKAVKKKVKYLVGFSKDSTKKQSLISRIKDKRQERIESQEEIEALYEEIEGYKAQIDALQSGNGTDLITYQKQEDTAKRGIFSRVWGLLTRRREEPQQNEVKEQSSFISTPEAKEIFEEEREKSAEVMEEDKETISILEIVKEQEIKPSDDGDTPDDEVLDF